MGQFHYNKELKLKIEFYKVTPNPLQIKFNHNLVLIDGNLRKINAKLVKLKAKIFGQIPHYICDRCGKEIILEINQDIELFISDGIFEDNENELSDTIEIFDGLIDIEEILHSEIEAYKSDYFYCQDCLNSN